VVHQDGEAASRETCRQERAGDPSFTVIITAFNAESYLPRTLDSILRQTFPDFEVVVVNDGSQDGTARVIRAYEQRDARVRGVHTPNRGISPARNLAVKYARAPWIAVCDADDTWSETKLERQALAIRNWNAPQPLLALGTCGYIINGADRIRHHLDFPQNPWPEYLREGAPVGQFVMINSSVVFRRDAFDALGGYRADYTPAEDTDLWVRLSERGAVVNLPERLTYYRVHGGNASASSYTRMLLNTYRILSNTRRRARGERELTYDEYHDELRRDPRAYARLMRNLTLLAYYTRGKNAWQDERPMAALLHLALCAALAPIRTARLLQASRVYRQFRQRVL